MMIIFNNFSVLRMSYMYTVCARHFSFSESELLLSPFYRCKYWVTETLWLGYEVYELIELLIPHTELLGWKILTIASQSMVLCWGSVFESEHKTLNIKGTRENDAGGREEKEIGKSLEEWEQLAMANTDEASWYIYAWKSQNEVEEESRKKGADDAAPLAEPHTHKALGWIPAAHKPALVGTPTMAGVGRKGEQIGMFRLPQSQRELEASLGSGRHCQGEKRKRGEKKEKVMKAWGERGLCSLVAVQQRRGAVYEKGPPVLISYQPPRAPAHWAETALTASAFHSSAWSPVEKDRSTARSGVSSAKID